MNLLRRLSYNPIMIRAARALHLRLALRKLYHRWAAPSDGLLTVQVAGVAGQFKVNTPEELRVLESAGGAGGEQRVIELLLSSVRPGDTIFDVGANVGLYTVLLAKKTGERGRVIAFEPEERTYEHLRGNLALNGLVNAQCFRMALGDHSGEAQLYSSQVIGNCSLLKQPGEAGGPVVAVQVVEGDRLVDAEKLPLPRIIKIDVEGYEHSVIQGLRRVLANPACEMVCCEVHPSLLPPDVESGQIGDSLSLAGFSRVERYPRWDGTFHLVAFKA